MTIKEGSLPREFKFLAFPTKEDAENWAENANENVAENYTLTRHRLKSNEISHEEKNRVLEDVAAIGTFHITMASSCLLEADVMSVDGTLSSEVISFLGKQRTASLKEAFGDDWNEAAALEYSICNFPFNSPVVIAARQLYTKAVLKDDFAAGYLLRDLQVVLEGLELLADRALEYSKGLKSNAQKGGNAMRSISEERKRIFNQIALDNLAEWISENRKGQARKIKRLVMASDYKDLFLQKGQPLSDSWFDDCTSELRISGKIKEIVKGYIP